MSTIQNLEIKLLEKSCIKKELNSLLNNLENKYIEAKEGKLIYQFENLEGVSAKLIVSNNGITLHRISLKRIEEIKVQNNFILNHRILERNFNNLIFSEIEKRFSISKNCSGKEFLTDIIDNKYMFEKNGCSNISFTEEFDKLNKLCSKGHMSFFSNHHYCFSAHIPYMSKQTSHPCVKINKIDYSNYFKNVKSTDRIYKIFNSIINSEYQQISVLANKEEIKKIRSIFR